VYKGPTIYKGGVVIEKVPETNIIKKGEVIKRFVLYHFTFLHALLFFVSKDDPKIEDYLSKTFPSKNLQQKTLQESLHVNILNLGLLSKSPLELANLESFFIFFKETPTGELTGEWTTICRFDDKYQLMSFMKNFMFFFMEHIYRTAIQSVIEIFINIFKNLVIIILNAYFYDKNIIEKSIANIHHTLHISYLFQINYLQLLKLQLFFQYRHNLSKQKFRCYQYWYKIQQSVEKINPV
jgi:hypothetical protein